jgi:hypothetical protein
MKTHKTTLPSGIVVEWQPVKVRHLLALQSIDRRDIANMSAWLAAVCNVTTDEILDLTLDDWRALSEAVVASLTPSKEESAPLGDGQPQPAKAT